MLGELIKGSTRNRTSVIGSLSLVNGAWLTVIASLGLSLLGVYAIDVGLQVKPHVIAETSPTAIKQLIFLCIGLLSGAVVALPHYRFITYIAWPVFILAILMLIFLLIPAVPSFLVTPRNGARGWINLGIVDFQPSEVTKVAFVLVAARYLRYRKAHRRFFGLVGPGLIAFVPMALIILQPDLGTACLFVPSLFAMLVAAGAKLRHLAVIILIAMLAAPVTYPALQPHQKARIAAMVKQVQGSREGAYDINYQSFTAQTLTGAGGAAGLNESKARAIVYFNKLPERHNDMIFAVIVSRFGLLGGLGVLFLYFLWVMGAVITAATCYSPFGRLLVVGLAGFIAAQVVVNIGMTIGLLPIIGVTLPFVSYGGSSLVTVWLMTGLVLNVGLRRPMPPLRSSFEYADDHGW